MGKTGDRTEQSPRAEVHPVCNGTGQEMETRNNPQQEQLLKDFPNGNGDAGRERDPGSRSPFRDPSVCKVCTCLFILAVAQFFVIIFLAVVLSKAPVTCPDGWVAFQGKCYYFSETEGNWTYSQNHCSTLGASLAGINTQQELDFMLRYRGLHDHWFGLSRERGPQPWRWVNGTKFNNWFQIGGGGECAYLKEGRNISSSRCYMERCWICSKPHTCAKV